MEGLSVYSSLQNSKDTIHPIQPPPHNSTKRGVYAAVLMMVLSITAVMCGIFAVTFAPMFSCNLSYYSGNSLGTYGYFGVCTGVPSPLESSSSTCMDWKKFSTIEYYSGNDSPTSGQKVSQVFGIFGIILSGIVTGFLGISFARPNKNLMNLSLWNWSGMIAILSMLCHIISFAVFVPVTAEFAGICFTRLEYGAALQIVTAVSLFVVAILTKFVFDKKNLSENQSLVLMEGGTNVRV